MNQVSCRVEKINLVPAETADSTASVQLTVGSEFYLSCQGEWPKNLNRDSIKFVLQPEQKYQIQLLSFEFRNPSLVDIKVTSYLVGQHRFENLTLTDGNQQVQLGPVDYVVQTVQAGEPVKEPFGPIGPVAIPIPNLYFVILFSSLLLVFILIAFKIRKKMQRKKLMESLREYDSVLSPIQQYYQSLRKLQRENVLFIGAEVEQEIIIQALNDIERMLKLYFLRKFQVPAFQWSVNDMLNEIKTSHRHIYDGYRKNIILTYKEVAKARKDEKKISTKDIIKISKDVTELLELIERAK